MIKKFISEIKTEWKRNKIATGFMAGVLLLAILTYLKPNSTSSIWTYLGVSAINLSILALIVLGVWWFVWRKRR